MKRKFSLLKITCLLLGIAACTPNVKNNELATGPVEKNKKAKNGQLSGALRDRVFMNVQPTQIKISTNNQARLIVTNSSKDSLLLGDLFYIEFYKEKSWNKLPVLEGISFNDIGYIIPPGQAKAIIINLRPKAFDYQPGRYRIRKPVQLMSSRRKLDLTAEFFIK